MAKKKFNVQVTEIWTYTFDSSKWNIYREDSDTEILTYTLDSSEWNIYR